MREADEKHAGQFVWHNLMAQSPEEEIEHHRATFGWTTQAMDMGALGPYTMFLADGQEIGGCVSLEQAEGIPSHWISYVAVPDLDRACRRVEAMGGTVCVPPTEIPQNGRFAVVGDPQGGYISPYQYDATKRADPQLPRGLGTFCWHELVTTDPEGAARFYTELFGWGVKTEQVPGFGEYWMFTRKGEEVAGMMRIPADVSEPHPAWVPYVQVADCALSLAGAQRHGASLCCPLVHIPGIGRFGVTADKHGAAIAHFQPDVP